MSKPVNLKTRRNGKRWFLVAVYRDGEPIGDFPVFAATVGTAVMVVKSALRVNRMEWSRLRAWAATDRSLDWEEAAS